MCIVTHTVTVTAMLTKIISVSLGIQLSSFNNLVSLLTLKLFLVRTELVIEPVREVEVAKVIPAPE